MRPYNKMNIDKVTRLVFNGGGTKGVAHPMAYAAFIACGGNVEKITALAGTSAGCIMAGFLAVGYSPSELHKEMSIDFIQFLDEDSGKIQVSKKVTKTTSKLQRGEQNERGSSTCRSKQ